MSSGQGRGEKKPKSGTARGVVNLSRIKPAPKVAGMMVGAVGWSTCKSTPILISHSHQSSDLMKPFFHLPLWSPGILLKFNLFLGSSVRVRRSNTLTILFASSFSPANKRHPSTRTDAER